MQAALHSCSFFLARLEIEVLRLKAKPFPGNDVGPRKWLNFISGVIGTGHVYVMKASDPKATPKEVSEAITMAEDLGNQAYQMLKHIAGTDTTQIPHQVVAPFQRWVERLQIGNTIFFRSEHLPNYELGWMYYQNFANIPDATPQLLASIQNEIKWPVLTVTVPGHAMGMLPHFAVVGHELGHAIQDQIKPDFTSFAKDEADLIGRIQVRLVKEGLSYGQKESLRLNEILINWINEIKADAVGYYISGPAFYFALFSFLELSNRGYGVYFTHPPSHQRRMLLINQFSHGAKNYLDVFNAGTGIHLLDQNINSPHIPACPPSDQLLQELKSILNPLDSIICTELVDFIGLIGGKVYEATEAHLQTICPELIYTPSQLESDLAHHLENLCYLVPPIEFYDAIGAHPTTLASIMNVGWAALLTRIDHIPEPNGDIGTGTAKKMERLHELLLKAVELSEAKRLWEEHK